MNSLEFLVEAERQVADQPEPFNIPLEVLYAVPELLLNILFFFFSVEEHQLEDNSSQKVQENQQEYRLQEVDEWHDGSPDLANIREHITRRVVVQRVLSLGKVRLQVGRYGRAIHLILWSDGHLEVGVDVSVLSP